MLQALTGWMEFIGQVMTQIVYRSVKEITSDNQQINFVPGNRHCRIQSIIN